MGKSAPTYLSIAVLVAAAAISQFPSSTATSDIDAGDISSPIAAEVTGIGKRTEEEKARIDKGERGEGETGGGGDPAPA